MSAAAPAPRSAGHLLRVRVTPRGGRNAVLGWDGDTLRVKVAAAPAGGAANRALVELLADYYRVPKSTVEIVRGSGSREKWVRVGSLGREALRGRG